MAEYVMDMKAGVNVARVVAPGTPNDGLLTSMLARLMVIARELKKLNERSS
jgi:hypothetical protein